MTYVLPALAIVVILAATLTYWRCSRLPPRCQRCGQRIHGSYASDAEAPAERPRYRCWPDCPTL